MTAAEALLGVSRLFLDTAPVVYWVEQNPTYASRVETIFDAVDAGSFVAVTSAVTLAEALIHPIRQGLVPLQADFQELITAGRNTVFVPIGAEQARRAADLRARYNLSLTDAFQVACALSANCDAFLTNDYGLNRITEIRILVLDALED